MLTSIRNVKFIYNAYMNRIYMNRRVITRHFRNENKIIYFSGTLTTISMRMNAYFLLIALILRPSIVHIQKQKRETNEISSTRQCPRVPYKSGTAVRQL